MQTQTFRPIPNENKSGLTKVATNIWTIEAPDCICYRPPMQPRYPYTHRAVVIRLKDNSLFIISPIRLTNDIRADIDALGTLKYIVSPNNIHHLHMGGWSQAYPDAKLYASPRLDSKRKDLTFYKTLSTDEPEPEWKDEIDQCVFGSGNGFVDEIVFFHHESNTVVFTDMIMDFDSAAFSSISRVTAQLNQMYKHTPRGMQLANMFNRESLRNSLNTVRSWGAEHLIVAHSPWLCVDGKEEVTKFLDFAFDWLTPRPTIVEAAITAVWFLVALLIILPGHALIVLILDIVYPKLIKQN
ncbi:DUF4336 domain-containing protein [Calothrix sp. CCY 0018]|uniref:DUF4336 domain-containing protein n=1 Tax=Calothrix sp. CCY 0018 TaxID=3103864 RepID=UPI0039C6C9B3